MCVHQSTSMCTPFDTRHTWVSHPLQNFMCDGLHNMTDSIPDILERLEQWRCTNYVLYVPSQEQIAWSYDRWPGWPLEKKASSSAARPIRRCGRTTLSRPLTLRWTCGAAASYWNRINGAVETITPEKLQWVWYWCVPGNERCAHRDTLMDAHYFGWLGCRLANVMSVKCNKCMCIWNPTIFIGTPCTSEECA
jgi:hypothetical protein